MSGKAIILDPSSDNIPAKPIVLSSTTVSNGGGLISGNPEVIFPVKINGLLSSVVRKYAKPSPPITAIAFLDKETYLQKTFDFPLILLKLLN